MTADPFGTRGLRAAVTAAWAASPSRFREDANSEEDHARGHYRDRVVVELAQNAADAAVRAGVPGELVLRLTAVGDVPVLVATNTGAPLDADGVASLASLRASAKRAQGDAVGRFGVGFAAVRSVADDVAVVSATGAVHFSVRRTAEVLAAGTSDHDVDGLRAEVARRSGSLPALRLPFEGPGELGAVAHLPAEGTAVVLALRDAEAVAQVRAELDAVDDALLLALPGLARVTVETDDVRRTVEDVASRWVVASAAGTLDDALLADRPVEERRRTGWQVTWAVPRPSSGAVVPPVVHAPTPTDEPCTVPALLVATLPLDPARRHVAPGPLADALVAHAGNVWADLLVACRGEEDAPAPLDLIPGGLASGRLDAALREAVLATTRTVPLLVPAGGGPWLAATDAVVLEGPTGEDPTAVAVLGRHLPGLVRADPRHRAALRALGVERTELSDVVEALPQMPPEALRALYDAVGTTDARGLEQLATLPVALADGRTVRGARGLLVVEAPPEALLDRLVGWGLRVVHPDAVHPLLERLGAARADAAGLLAHPVVRERVLSAEEDHAEVAEVVLGLLGAAGPAHGEVAPAWWGELLLPDEDGEPTPARGLALPGTDAAAWFDPEVLPHPAAEVLERWSPAVLAAAGARTGLTVERVPAAHEVDAEDGELVTHALDGWEDYLDHLHGGVGDAVDELPELEVVADLDAVRAEAWPAVLTALGRGAPRRALLAPVRLPGPAGPVDLPSYTAWWLRHRSGLVPGRPFAMPGAPAALAALLAPAPAWADDADPEVLAALGGVRDLDGLDAAGWEQLLDALPPVLARVDVALAVRLWRGLAARALRDGDLTLHPDCLPALVGEGETVVVPADEVAVAEPMWAQHVGVTPLLVVSREAVGPVADALDLDVAPERAPGRVTSPGHVLPMPAVVLDAYPDAPATWAEHDDLRVDGRSVTWWVGPDGDVHAATTEGLARAVARTVGWGERDRVERLLTTPAARDVVLLEMAGDPGG